MVRIVLLSLLLVLPARAQDAPRPIVFEHVNVVPMDREHVLPDHTVVVRGDRITAVGPAADVDVPAEAERIDGRGRYLLPGLAEMHGHVPPPTAPAAFTEDVLFLYVANGITTVRGMLGAEGQLALRSATASGALLGPTLYLAGPSFNGRSVRAPEQAEEMVRAQAAEGWDLLKVHPGLTRAEYDAMARTANEVGIRFGGHVPEDVGLLHALAMGQETFDHLDGYIAYLDGAAAPIPEDRLRDVARRTREAGAWVVPTMVLWETLYGTAPLEALRALPELRYLPPDMVAGWIGLHEGRLAAPGYDAEAARQRIDNRMRLLRVMNEEGVGILMGTDAPQQFSVPGFSLHNELARMAEAGMTPYEILRTGTAHVGRYFAGEDAFGTVAPGMRADLMLVDADPLADVAHLREPAGVMVRGRWLPREAIRERLEAIAAGYGHE